MRRNCPQGGSPRGLVRQKGRGLKMKLHDALRKVIRHFGVNVIEEKRLMSFLADYKAFDDYPAVKEVMKCIATGDSGKKICLAADGSDEEFLRLADEIRETLVREKSFKEEFARYAVDSVSFALGIVSDVTEPGDHGYEAMQKNTGSQGSSGAQESTTQGSQAAPQAAAPTQSGSGTAFTVSGDTWLTASDGAESHRRFYRGHDLTAAFDSGEFSRNVADGSFRDIFPGDYIIKKVTVPDIKKTDGSVYINGYTYTITFIIADLDTALNCVDSGVTAHHSVIVPYYPPFKSYMNPTETNKGGYAKSFMHDAVIPAFANGLAAAFGPSHLLSFNADAQSYTCRLMTLSMVFGEMWASPWWSGHYSWSDYAKDNCLGGVQFAAFHLKYNTRRGGNVYWLSDLSHLHSGSSEFADAWYGGRYDVTADTTDAHTELWVRPFALLV